MGTFKTVIRMSPHRLVYDKTFHLPVKLEHKAHWAVKRLNFDLDKIGESRKLQLDVFEEIRNDAYDYSKWYKDRMKIMHDRVITRMEFQPGQKVLLYNSRLHLFPKKLKSHWTGTYIVHKVHPHGVKVHNATDGTTFQLNGHLLKSYSEYMSPEVEKIILEDHIYQV